MQILSSEQTLPSPKLPSPFFGCKCTSRGFSLDGIHRSAHLAHNYGLQNPSMLVQPNCQKTSSSQLGLLCPNAAVCQMSSWRLQPCYPRARKGWLPGQLTSLQILRGYFISGLLCAIISAFLEQNSQHTRFFSSAAACSSGERSPKRSSSSSSSELLSSSASSADCTATAVAAASPARQISPDESPQQQQQRQS